MIKKRREIQVFNLSFLDVVSCGFGAIILLLVISKIAEPLVVEKMSADLSGLVIELERQLHEIRGETLILNRELKTGREQIADRTENIARLQEELTLLRGEFRAARTELEAQAAIARQLETARQTLTDEMQRLQSLSAYRPPEAGGVIGGVPVDSEYIIFIIDTSGSMQRFAWPLVRRKMAEIFEIYPHVQGLQVMNDMGDYMFSQYAGRWIPDSPARRRSILQRLASWAPFSNSSPVEGITSAIRRFSSPDRNISLYVLGDDFSRGSIQEVLDEVARYNDSLADGRRRVRIHAVGFPVLFSQPAAGMNVARFAALMRRLAEENNGSFVGLNSLQ